MNITAAELKHAIKKLSPSKSENYQIGEGTITAQDSDVWIVENCPLFGLGVFNLNGKKLSQTVNRMSGNIEISQTEKSIILKSAKARIELETFKVTAPAKPETPEKTFQIPVKDFKQALSVSAASASPNKSAAFGNVVLVQSLPPGLEESTSPGYRVIGTDGLVLSLSKVKFPLQESFSFLLNLSAVGVVQLMDEEAVEIGETLKHVYLKTKSTTLWASKPLQKYPSFDVLFKDEPKIVVGFNTQNWIQALRTVEPVTEELTGLSLLFDQGVVEWNSVGVGARASDESEYEQLEPDPVFDPRKFNLKINAKYLSGFLSKAGEDAIMKLVAFDKPVRFESGNTTVLTMPMAVTK